MKDGYKVPSSSRGFTLMNILAKDADDGCGILQIP